MKEWLHHEYSLKSENIFEINNFLYIFHYIILFKRDPQYRDLCKKLQILIIKE